MRIRRCQEHKSVTLMMLLGAGGLLGKGKAESSSGLCQLQPCGTLHSCRNAEPGQDDLKLQSCLVKPVETAAHLRFESAYSKA